MCGAFKSPHWITSFSKSPVFLLEDIVDILNKLVWKLFLMLSRRTALTYLFTTSDISCYQIIGWCCHHWVHLLKFRWEIYLISVVHIGILIGKVHTVSAVVNILIFSLDIGLEITFSHEGLPLEKWILKNTLLFLIHPFNYIICLISTVYWLYTAI